MKQLTHGSLFAGIGGFDLGFERAGIKTVWQVEINPFCRRVLERHFPEAERFTDIRDCGARNLKPVDVICGGFPCQDISVAGAMLGIEEGKRSGLWSEMRRVVSELRPRIIVVENVANLLARDIGRVLGDLAALGYDSEWECLSAAIAGAPHIRDRVFILAYTASIGWNISDDKAPSVLAGNSIPNFEQSGYRWERKDGGHSVESLGWTIKPEICGSDDGIPAELAKSELHGLGNAVVPQIAEWIGRRIVEATLKENQ